MRPCDRENPDFQLSATSPTNSADDSGGAYNTTNSGTTNAPGPTPHPKQLDKALR